MNRHALRPVLLFAALPALALALALPADAETYRVGAERQDKTLASVLPRLRAGDVVEIDPGTYRETARLTANGTADAPITFRGVGESMPVFDAEGLDTSGRGPVPRAILQIQGAHVVVENLVFVNARNGENAAGIRLLDSTNAVVRNCKISRCDMGLFGGDRETALVEGCDIFENGTETFNGYSHNLYMDGNRVIVRNCHIHDALFGQNYKSRAHYNELWFNHVAGSAEGEIGCVDGEGRTDRPNSNVLMVGNVVVSKADRTGNAAKFVLFGSEGEGAHDGTLFLFRNAFVAGSGRIDFVTLDDPRARLAAFNNAFVGSDKILNLIKSSAVKGGGNRLPGGADAPPGWRGPPAAPANYVDGDGETHALDLGPRE